MGNRQIAWGWFATLRRDRVLFAIAGTLVLLTHVFQPWAEARAANTANAWVICTTFGMQMGTPDGKKLPPAGAADDCPQCIGACGGMAVQAKAAEGGRHGVCGARGLPSCRRFRFS